jgi:hypothetical protein
MKLPLLQTVPEHEPKQKSFGLQKATLHGRKAEPTTLQ